MLVGTRGASGGDLDGVGQLGTQVVGEQTGPGGVGAGEHDSRRGVAEEDTGGAVGGIGDPGRAVGREQQDGGDGGVLQEVGRDQHGLDAGRAGGGRDVQGERAVGAEGVLDDERGRQQRLVPRVGGDDDRVQPGGLDTGGFQSRVGGGDAHVGGRQVRGQTAAFADSGAADDPLVAGVQGAGELLVGDDRRRQVDSRPGDGERYGQARAGLVEEILVQGDGHRRSLRSGAVGASRSISIVLFVLCRFVIGPDERAPRRKPPHRLTVIGSSDQALIR